MIELGIPGDRISVIPTGVDLNKFYPVSKERARSKLGLPKNEKIILSVGYLTENKGFDLLIKALKMLSGEFHKEALQLVIAGEGLARNDLEKLISSLGLGDVVRLVGGIPHQGLYLWYSAADLFCLVSKEEGWPNVLLEAMACGTPVVATPVGGIPEIISSNRIGLLTRRNEKDIAKAISIGLKKRWDHDEIIQFARNHTWHEVVQSVHAVFESVIG
jgi:glycosyltransferase involved in cell wall biosynthesis